MSGVASTRIAKGRFANVEREEDSFERHGMYQQHALTVMGHDIRDQRFKHLTFELPIQKRRQYVPDTAIQEVNLTALSYRDMREPECDNRTGSMCIAEFACCLCAEVMSLDVESPSWLRR
jgi:hypothetical protein